MRYYDYLDKFSSVREPARLFSAMSFTCAFLVFFDFHFLKFENMDEGLQTADMHA